VDMGDKPMIEQEHEDEKELEYKPDRRQPGHWEYVHCNLYWVPDLCEDEDDEE
jgi:hypothetical protein